MHKPVSLIRDYVLEKSTDESVRMRAQLYRALADIEPSPTSAKELKRLAEVLESVDRNSAQLALDFRTRAN